MSSKAERMYRELVEEEAACASRHSQRMAAIVVQAAKEYVDALAQQQAYRDAGQGHKAWQMGPEVQRLCMVAIGANLKAKGY